MVATFASFVVHTVAWLGFRIIGGWLLVLARHNGSSTLFFFLFRVQACSVLCCGPCLTFSAIFSPCSFMSIRVLLLLLLPVQFDALIYLFLHVILFSFCFCSCFCLACFVTVPFWYSSLSFSSSCVLPSA